MKRASDPISSGISYDRYGKFYGAEIPVLKSLIQDCIKTHFNI